MFHVENIEYGWHVSRLDLNLKWSWYQFQTVCYVSHRHRQQTKCQNYRQTTQITFTSKQPIKCIDSYAVLKAQKSYYNFRHILFLTFLSTVKNNKHKGINEPKNTIFTKTLHNLLHNFMQTSSKYNKSSFCETPVRPLCVELSY